MGINRKEGVVVNEFIGFEQDSAIDERQNTRRDYHTGIFLDSCSSHHTEHGLDCENPEAY